MSVVILNHKVKDFDKWKNLYDADASMREQAGITELAVGRKAGEPDNVFMIWKIKDLMVVEEMLQSAHLKEKMEAAGVISIPEVIVLE